MKYLKTSQMIATATALALAAPAAVAQTLSFGSSCAGGSGARPTLVATPRQAEQSKAVELTVRSAPHAAGSLLIGERSDPIGLSPLMNGCQLSVRPVLAFPFAADATGSFRIDVPPLAVAPVSFQAVLLDPGPTTMGATTNAIALVDGDHQAIDVPTLSGSRMRVSSGRVRRAQPDEAGAPLATLPGARHVSAAQVEQMATPLSGLFLVDTPFVPRGLAEELAADGLTLLADGSLVDAAGQPVTLFVKDVLWAIEPSDGAAANPLPGSDRSFSFYGWRWKTSIESGFCRHVRSWTDVYAYDQHGQLMPINMMWAGAYVGSGGDDESCYNCSALHAYDRDYFGCGWPAIYTSFYHYGYWQHNGWWATLQHRH